MSIDRLQATTPQTLNPTGLKAVPTSTAAKIVAATHDQARLGSVKTGIPAVTDQRRERAFGLAQQMLTPNATESHGIKRWVMPSADQATQQQRGLRLAAELQDPRLLTQILPLMGKYGPTCELANETFTAIVPFADANTLRQLKSVLAATKDSGLTTATKAVDDALMLRELGTPAKAPDMSGTAIHFQEAAHGALDMVKDMTVGTAKQVYRDPLRFPTQLIAGVGVSLHNAVKNTGGAVVGLVTAGRFGSFGAQMTQELGNTALWGSGFAKARKTNLYPQFAEVQKGAKEGFYRDLSSHGQFIPSEPVLTNKLSKGLHLPQSVANGMAKVERGVMKSAMSFVYGTEVILPGETKQVKGTIWRRSGEELSTADHIIGTENKAVNDLFANKWQEFQILDGAVKGSMPETHLGKNLIAELGLELPKTQAERPAFVVKLQAKLNEKFPQGYFLKGVRDYNTGGNLPTNKTNFGEAYKGFVTEYKPLVEKLRKEHPNDDLQPMLNNHPFQSGRTLDALMENPESVIIQEKLPLKKFTQKEQPLNKQPFQEFRVHTVKGQVIPGGSAHRWSDMHTLTDRKTMKAAEAFVQTVMDKMSDDVKKKAALSPDVVQLEDGSFKIIEMNAGGDSGFLHPVTEGMPIFKPAHNLVEAVTGKETDLFYVARRAKISVAVAATGATHQQHARVQNNQE